MNFCALLSAGDEAARLLWLEYFAATSGKRRRQLVWSKGLKSRCGVNEVKDEDAAAEETAQEEDEVGSWDRNGWRRVRTKRVRLMEAAERGGAAAVRAAESGPDDATADAADDLIERDESAEIARGIGHEIENLQNKDYVQIGVAGLFEVFEARKPDGIND